MKDVSLSRRFARNLDLLRHARKLSADDFTSASGVSRQQLSLWRLGRTAATLSTVEEVSERLGVDPSTILAKEPAEVLRGQE